MSYLLYIRINAKRNNLHHHRSLVHRDFTNLETWLKTQAKVSRISFSPIYWLRQSTPDGSLVNPYRFVNMLSFLGAGSSSLRSLGSSSRSYSSGASTTSQRPALVWNHGHASTKPQQQVQLPESSHGVSSELIAKLRRLREEAPKTFTARRLMSNFNLSKKTINAVAPYVRHGKAVRSRSSASLRTGIANFTI